MKVRISYTVECDEYFRRALNAYFGKDGLATRQDIIEWYEGRGGSCDADMLYEFEHNKATLKINENTACTVPIGTLQCHRYASHLNRLSRTN